MLETLFDAAFYLQTNGDVAAAGFTEETAINHYLEFGFSEERKPHPLFDTEFYFDQRLDVFEVGIEPFGHYLNFGFEEDTLDGSGGTQSDPNRFFDSAEYLADNPDVDAFGANPLAHYIAFGEEEILAGFRVEPTDFEPIYYAGANPDVAAAVEAGVFDTYLEHFLLFGEAEGRSPTDPNPPPPASIELRDSTETGPIVRLDLITNPDATDITVPADDADGVATIAGQPNRTDVLNLRGDASVRIDFTAQREQLEQIDINGDGVFEPGTDEFNARPDVDVEFFEILDAHPRIADLNGDGDVDDVGENGLLDPTNTELGFTGDILFDGTGFAGDGVNTNGNIFLGGWGDDDVFVGDGNDFLSGGGGENLLSGGRNADFFYVELSTLDQFFTGAQTIKAGNTGDDGGVDGPQDKDWLLLEASDDQEVTRIDLNLDDAITTDGTLPDIGGVESENGVIDFGAGDVGVGAFLEDVENVNASGSFYGFLDVLGPGGDVVAIEVAAVDFSLIEPDEPAYDTLISLTFRFVDENGILVEETIEAPEDSRDFETYLSLTQAALEPLGFLVEETIVADATTQGADPVVGLLITDTQAEDRDFVLNTDGDPEVIFNFTDEGVAQNSSGRTNPIGGEVLFPELFFGDFRDFTPDPENGIVRVPGLSPGSTAQLDIAGTDDMNTIIGGYDNDVINGGGGMDLLFGGDLQFLLTFRNNANLFDSNGALVANTRDAGPGSIAVGDQVADDGRDTLLGGAGDDNLVFELDRGTYIGDGAQSTADGLDTLWLTDFTAGRVGGDVATQTPNFIPTLGNGNTGSESPAIATLTTDSVIRIDLGVGLGSEYQGFGGADDLVDGVLTADQTNYDSAADRTVVQGLENINASGLGGIDYLAAGTNDPELLFDNQQNYNGTAIDLDLRGIDTEDAINFPVDDNAALDNAPDINDLNFSELQMLHFVAGVDQVVSFEGPVQPLIEGGFNSADITLSPTAFNAATVFTDYETLRGDGDGDRFSVNDNGFFRLDSDQGLFQSDDSLNTDRVEFEQNSLISGAGDDTIEGRGGDDRLSGREGDDTFYISLNDGDNAASGPELSLFGDNVNFISRDLDIFTYESRADAPVLGEGDAPGGANPDGLVDRIDSEGRLSNNPEDRVLIGQDFRPPSGPIIGEAPSAAFAFSASGGFRVENDDDSPFSSLQSISFELAGGAPADNIIPPLNLDALRDQGIEIDTAEQLADVIEANLQVPAGVTIAVSVGAPVLAAEGITVNDASEALDDANTVEIVLAGEAIDPIVSSVPGFTAAGGTSGYDALAALDPGGPDVEGVEDDKLVFVSYNNRLDNEKADDLTESLGKEAYAEDLVVRFDGTSTTIAEGQEYQIYFDDLAKGDIVTVKINGQEYQLTVGFDRDGNDIGAETTEAFAARLAGVINVTRANDPHTAAGSVFAQTVNDVPGNTGDVNDAVLVVRQTPVLTEEGGTAGTENITAARAEQVFMDLPVVIVDEAQTTGDNAIVIVKDTSDTATVLFGYDGRAEAEGLNRGIAADADRDDGRYITFEGETEQNRSILQTADPDSTAVLQGLEAFQGGFLVPDTQDFTPPTGTDTGNVGGTSDDPTSGIGEPGTSTPTTDGWAAIHGDDLLIGSRSGDSISALTGDDRIVGSQGIDFVDGGADILFNPVDGAIINPALSSADADAATANTFANAVDVVRFIDTLVFEERDFLDAGASNNPAFSIVPTGNGTGQVLVDDDTPGFFQSADHTTTFTNMEIVRTLSGNSMGTQLADDELDLGQLSAGVAFILEDDPVFHDAAGNLLPGFVDGNGNPLVVEVSQAAWEAESLPINGAYSGAISVRQVPGINILPTQAEIDAAFVAADEALIVEGVERIAAPPPAVGVLNVDDQTNDEDAGVIVFEVTRGSTAADDVRFQVLAVDDDVRDAAEASDFVGATGNGTPLSPFLEGTVEFIDGGTTGLVSVPIFNDIDAEGPEDFIFRVFSESGALVEDTSQGTIIDDDAPEIGVGALIEEFPVDPAVEAGTVTFTISLSDLGSSTPLDPDSFVEATGDVAVVFQITGNLLLNPTSADDFGLGGEFGLTEVDAFTIEGTAIIEDGDTSVTVTVPALFDGVDEGTEDFLVSIVDVIPDTVGGTGDPQVPFPGFDESFGTLDDAVDPPLVLTITPDVTTINETDSNSVTYTVTTENAAAGSVVTIGIDGASTAGADDLSGLPSTVTVGADGTATFTVTADADLTTEGDESLILEAAIGGQPPVDAAAVTIEDTSLTPVEPVVLAITPDVTTINETDSNSVTYTITTENTVGGETVTLAIDGASTAGSGDISGLPATVTVAADGTATFTVTAEADLTTEGDESLIIEAAIGAQTPVDAAAVTIEDTSTTPTAAVVVSITADVTTIDESGTTVTYTVVTENAVGESIVLTLAGASTAERADVTGLPFTTTVQADGTATFTVEGVADQTTEGDEVLIVEAAIGTQTPIEAAAVTIEDTSTTPVVPLVVSITADVTTIDESGATVTYTVVTENAVGESVVLTLDDASTAERADVTGLPFTTTVQADGTATFTVEGIADLTTEGDEILIVEAAIGTQTPIDAAAVTIEDTSLTPVVAEVVSITPDVTTIDEDGTITATYTIVTSNAVGETVAITIDGASTAEAADVTGLPSTVTVEADGTATFTITGVADLTTEGDEDLVLEAAIGTQTPVDAAAVTIEDTSLTPVVPEVVSITPDVTTVEEDGTTIVTYTVATANTVGGEVVTLAIDPISVAQAEDISGLPATVTVAADGTASFTITADADQTTEGDETLIIEGGIGTQTPVDAAVVTIIDTSTDPVGPVDVSVDNQGVVGGAVVTLDASTGSFNFTDAVTAVNNVEITGFGLDDTITFSGVTIGDVGYQESGGNTQLEIDDGAGLVSRITLIGISVGAFGVDGFNTANDGTAGDILFA